jgi:DnaK suppressor protein
MRPPNLDPTTLRQTLHQRLADLRQSSVSTADSRKPVALDQASVGRLSRMDAMQMQAMAQAAERMRSREIARVEAALERLDAGDYGYCVTCGEAISEKRLATDSTIPTCISCATAAKR